jgi:osmoprotectant transport system permease protein
LGILACLLALAWGIMRQPETGVEAQGGTVTIGSKNFTEAVILGELLAQQIERNTDLAVDRRFNLGGTFICHEAVKSGKIDGYVEYTGTALTAILKQPPLNDPRQVFRQVQKAYARLGLTAFPSLGFNNTFAIVIRQSDAEKYHLKTLSQAARFTPNWKAGFGYEFLARQDGFPGLAEAYGLKFAETPQAMELGLLYRALADRQVDLVAGNSTDGSIPVLNLSVLEDDRRYFPPYEAIPVFNSQTLQEYPQLRPVLRRLSNILSAETMQRLNYQVDSQADSVEGIVENFLRSRVPVS